MKYYITTVLLLIALQASAQLIVGSSGMTVLPGTPLQIDGLTLTPSTALTIVNNSIQRINSPGAGAPNGSINRAYQFGAPLAFSGNVRIQYQTAELNGRPEQGLQLAYSSVANGPYTIATGSTVDATNDFVSNSVTGGNLFVVTATALSDLTPITYAQPSTQYGNSPFNIIVEVYELNAVATQGSFSVRINKDPKVSLTFSPNATSVGGQAVNNSAWSFNASDEDYYILTTNQSIAAGDVLSFGLNAMLNPSATSGVLSINSLVLPGTLVETSLTNNIDAERINYFQR
ncbi:hypothetical protein [Spirosoma sp.]|uniref:hypothetical protein n=1 Tax=Spirosoma sp. TaxID=1899569 RepID=UPI003B3A15EE